MYIAIELGKLLNEKATADTKAMENVALKVFCKPEDPMSVADHMWLNELKGIEYKDAMRSGNEVLDAGMTAGTLLGEPTDGIYVTDLETLLMSGTASNGKCTVSFANGLKDAMEMYKKSEKAPVKRTRRTKAEMAATRQEDANEATTETAPMQNNVVEEPTVTETASVPFPMPAPQNVDDTPVEENTTAVENTTTVDGTMATDTENTADTPAEVEQPHVQETPATPFPLKNQHDRFNALKFEQNEMPEGPEFDQFKKLAIQHGVSNANVTYALTALQISDGADDLLHSLVSVYGNYKTEAYTVFNQIKGAFAELKTAADQVVPFDISL